MIRFSLLHPSRGRLERAAQAIGEWTARRSGAHAVEHILSVDTDDDVAGYRRVADAAGVRLVVNANRSVVDAANAAARAATGDVLIVVSKVKKYIRDRSGMNTSDAVAEELGNHVRTVCDEAIRAAVREKFRAARSSRRSATSTTRRTSRCSATTT